MFEDMGGNIPGSAAFLFGLSNWLKSYGWTLIGMPILFWFGWRQWNLTPERRLHRDDIMLSLPILGNLILHGESSRFCRTLGALLGANVSLPKGLHIAKGVMENQVLANSLAEIEKNVYEGVSLGRALLSNGKFPVLLSQLVIIGEESGRTANILNKLADTFDNTVKKQISRLMTLLEPLLILILGIAVGAIVIIMLSAIFSINEVNY
jgi:general secretion pathway protein F